MKPKLLITMGFVLLCCMAAQQLYAQNSPEKHAIDSLTQRLAKLTGNDTARAATLNRLAYQYRHVDTVKGTAYAQQALTLSQKLKWDTGIGFAYHNLGANCANNIHQSIAYISKAIPINQRCNNRAVLELDYYGLGWQYIRIQEKQKSIANYNMALKLTIELKDKPFTGDILGEMGDVYFGMKDTTKALDYYKRDIAVKTELKANDGLIPLLTWMGNFYLNKGNMITARNYFQQCHAIGVATGSKAYTSDGLWNIGATYLPTDMDKALDYYNQAIKLKEELHNYEDLGNIYSILGGQYYGKSNEKALKYFYQSVQAFQQASDKANTSDNEWNIGFIYAETDPQKSFEYLQRALKTKEELQNNAFVVKIAAKMGDMYARQQNTTKAIDYYKITAEYELKMNDKAGYSNTLWGLGTLYSGFDANKGVDYYKQAEKVKQEIHDNVSAFNLLLNIGGYYLGQKNYDAATDYFQQGLTLSHSMHDNKLVVRAIAAIASVYQARDGAGKMVDYLSHLLANTNNDAERAGILSIQGDIYSGQNDLPKGLGKYLESLQLSEKIKDQSTIGHTLDMISAIYLEQKKTDKALDYGNRAYKLYMANNDKPSAVTALNGIANAYNVAKEYEKAVAKYKEAEEMLGPFDQSQLAILLGNIGDTYKNEGKYIEANDYVMRSIKVATPINGEYQIAVDRSTLAEIYIVLAKDKSKLIPNDTIFPKDRKVLLEKAMTRG